MGNNIARLVGIEPSKREGLAEPVRLKDSYAAWPANA